METECKNCLELNLMSQACEFNKYDTILPYGSDLACLSIPDQYESIREFNITLEQSFRPENSFHALSLTLYKEECISLNEIMEKLAKTTGRNFSNAQIFHRTEDTIYEFAGIYPFTKIIKLKVSREKLKTMATPAIWIKYRPAAEIKKEQKVKKHKIEKHGRGNERKIEEVIELLYEWHKLYTRGLIDKNGKTIKVNKKEAAERMKISRKSLDDYMLNIQRAKKYGFDFNAHKESKMGFLRKFLRKARMSKK